MLKSLFRTFLLVTITASCGGPSSTTIETVATSTTVKLGTSCNQSEIDIMLGHLTDYKNAKEMAANSRAASLRKANTERNALIQFRRHIRKLDIPPLADKQALIVEETETYLSAFNLYVSSEGKDPTVLDAVIPFMDALEDFVIAFDDLCGDA
jgi:hypothetical protein